MFPFGGGNLIIFDNGNNFLPEGESRNYSRVIDVNMKNKEIVWEYKSKENEPLFFSPIVGAQQRFKNGNTMITEGYYGRIFEVDESGEIVYDFTYPEYNSFDTPKKDQTGLRQLYRAYKVGYDWIE